MEMLIGSHKKISEYSISMHGALDRIIFPIVFIFFFFVF